MGCGDEGGVIRIPEATSDIVQVGDLVAKAIMLDLADEWLDREGKE